MSCLQGLLKKHVAFETDFQVHLDRFDVIKGDGDKLTEEVSELIYMYKNISYLSELLFRLVANFCMHLACFFRHKCLVPRGHATYA